MDKKKLAFGLTIAAVLGLAVIVLVLRMGVFSFYPQNQAEYQDYGRDYLVANHIVRYHEMLMVGPDGQFGHSFVSPVYFYFLATILLISNNIIFLGYANVFLQCVAWLAMFYLAYGMFGGTSGFMAAVLFGLSQNILFQSTFPWSPYLMQPFLLASFALLLYGYKSKKYAPLLLSISFFSLAGIIHSSAFALVPAFVIILFLILKYQARQAWHHLAVLLNAFLCFTVAYLLPFIYLRSTSQAFFPADHNFTAGLTSADVLFKVKNFLNFFTPRLVFSLLDVLVFIVIFGAIFFLYQRSRTHKPAKLYMLVLGLALLQFFFVFFLMNFSSLYSFPIRYCTPVMAIFIIIVVEFINHYTEVGKFSFVLKTIVLAIALNTVSPNLADRLVSIGSLSSVFAVRYVTDPAVRAVKEEVLEIQASQNMPDLNFFQLKSFRSGYLDEDEFWPSLERELDSKFTQNSDKAYRSYFSTNLRDYIFALCAYAPAAAEQTDTQGCRTEFLEANPSYVFVKLVYSAPPLSIYLFGPKSLGLSFKN